MFEQSPLNSDQHQLRELGPIINQGIPTVGNGCRDKNQSALEKCSFAVEVHQETRKGGSMNKRKKKKQTETKKERKTNRKLQFQNTGHLMIKNQDPERSETNKISFKIALAQCLTKTQIEPKKFPKLRRQMLMFRENKATIVFGTEY